MRSSRRAFLRGLGLFLASSLAASCEPTGQAGTEQEGTEQVETPTPELKWVVDCYEVAPMTPEPTSTAQLIERTKVLIEMTKRMWRKMEQIGDESLLNSHYNTLRTAPIGPQAAFPDE